MALYAVTIILKDNYDQMENGTTYTHYTPLVTRTLLITSLSSSSSRLWPSAPCVYAVIMT
ncbi:hypothetical protein NQ318_016063 [Aromia moschata]|uniref:Uncharacterized protein n=1 Tax=Aromia moschata TaxID=1265417 RepID=A0AAV8XR67_9CUCU|nr:hypothetical protein NQ318_016063 [Aromia moschata]